MLKAVRGVWSLYQHLVGKHSRDANTTWLICGRMLQNGPGTRLRVELAGRSRRTIACLRPNPPGRRAGLPVRRCPPTVGGETRTMFCFQGVRCCIVSIGSSQMLPPSSANALYTCGCNGIWRASRCRSHRVQPCKQTVVLEQCWVSRASAWLGYL